MRLVMVGLDYKTAGMEIREAFSPDLPTRMAVLPEMATGDIAGCALVATCNRTELYISHNGDVPPDGVGLLCRALERDERRYRRHFTERAERQAVDHLMQVAGGMQSSVLGDDQIITQVRSAIETAREAGTADPLLEALFRSAIAAGKKIKTLVSFAREGASVARQAVEAVGERLGGLAGKQGLVIGNGAIGRLAAADLADRGCQVAVTLRDLRRLAEVPAGCACVDFQDRIGALEKCDFVISATSSPRHTITLGDVRGLDRLPCLFVDLAIPRDIEPSIADLGGITLLNVDDLRTDGLAEKDHAPQLARANEIVAEEAQRFDLWRRSRQRHTRSQPGEPDFPIFINLHGATVLVAGGGKVAARRAEKLLGFGARVRLVSPAVSEEMEELLGRNGLEWTRDSYRPEHMDGVTLAIAATDQREVNRRIGEDARERGVLISVADRRQECTFYFPAIVKSDYFTAGLISNHNDHKMVRQAAITLRQEMEAIDEMYKSGEPRERTGGGAGASGHGSGEAPPA